MNHSRGCLPETTTPLGRAADKIECLKAIVSQQERQIVLLVDKVKAQELHIAVLANRAMRKTVPPGKRKRK